jgi:hypothetical protein
MNKQKNKWADFCSRFKQITQKEEEFLDFLAFHIQFIAKIG